MSVFAGYLEQVLKAGWDESAHPRGADGKFGEGSIGKTKSKKNIPASYGGATSVEAIKAAHPDYTSRDHMNAWAEHSNKGNAAIASAHLRAATDKREGKAPSSEELAPHEKESLSRYQGTGFVGIQDHLRSGTEDHEAAAHVKGLDSAIGKSGLREDTTLYRGLGGQAAEEHIAKAKPGALVTDDGYVSTSRHKDVAHEFARARDEQEEAPGRMAVLHINARKGQKALETAKHVSTVSAQREGEHILPRGTKLRIKRVEVHGDTHHIHADIEDS